MIEVPKTALDSSAGALADLYRPASRAPTEHGLLLPRRPSVS